MARTRDAIVVLGEVVGPYGVRGWIRVRSHAEAPETLLGHANWWLKSKRGPDWRVYARTAGRMHSGALLAELGGIATREAALALKGHEIGVPRSALPEPAAEEIYWEDLTGFAVVNRGGVLLGAVCGMTEHGAHPLLRVARPPGCPGPERLIPFVPAIVGGVDMVEGRIEVDWGEDY
jgi:16S rRNA processing protein RimM